MGLDRSSPMPLWAQLEQALKERLDGGEFDERFPTDGDLVEEYGVSRHTVREAIRHLNSTGILRRERGRGTVVNRTEFEQPLGALYSLFRSIEESGVEQRSTVLQLREDSDPVIAERLGLAPSDPLLFVERVRFAGDEPLAIDRAWMPLALTKPLLRSNFERTALYDEMEAKCGFRPDSGWERFTPVVPSAADQALLGMRRGQAAFFLERESESSGKPVEWRTTTIRGDRYRFLSNFGTGHAPSLAVSASD